MGSKIDHIDNRILIAAKSNLSEEFKKKVNCLFIDQLIESAEQVSQYFVLFNLQDLLSTEQEDKIASRLLNFDFRTCNEEKMFEVSSRIAKSYPALSLKIENEIIENKLLWHNGISFDKHHRRIISHGPGFIKISRVQENLNFSDSTIKEIFVILNKSFASITEVIKGSAQEKSHIFLMESHWAKLLLEMQLFLRNNKSILQLNKDFEKVIRHVEPAYYQLTKTNSIMDGLISSNDHQIRESIQKLVYEVESFGVKKFTPEYLVIVNLIALKADLELNSYINNFASVIQYYCEDIDKELFKPFVVKILEKYEEYFSNPVVTWDISAKKEDVEEAMLQLNNVACEWNVGNEYWSNHKRIFKDSE